MKKYLVILMLLFIVKLYYGPEKVEQWETNKVKLGLGYVAFTDIKTGNYIQVCGTWSIVEVKEKKK